MIETTDLPPAGAYRITCGWCGRVAEPPICGHCGRDPERYWRGRGVPAPRPADSGGRPTLDGDDIRRQYAAAKAALAQAGKPATVEAIAEQLDRSPRTVREWRKRFDLE